MKDYRLQKLCVACVVTTAIDQISKHFAQNVILNTGVSFGVLSHPILTLVLLAVLVAIAFQFGKTLYESSALFTGVFFGASLSNIIDRILYGGVRDFLPVPVLSVQNNLADWAIILSLVWLFFRIRQSSDTNTV